MKHLKRHRPRRRMAMRNLPPCRGPAFVPPDRVGGNLETALALTGMYGMRVVDANIVRDVAQLFAECCGAKMIAIHELNAAPVDDADELIVQYQELDALSDDLRAVHAFLENGGAK